MRISDWSSDVCSSDLIGEQFKPFQRLEACFDFCAVCRGPLRVADHERSDYRIGIDVERQLKPPVIVEKDVGVDSQPASECRGADEAFIIGDRFLFVDETGERKLEAEQIGRASCRERVGKYV